MTMRTAAMYRHFYRSALGEVRAEREAYDAEVADWYTNGDGRPAQWDEVTIDHGDGEVTVRSANIGGRGYRFPHCPHGMSLWTDYDNICGACEDSLTVMQDARCRARSRFYNFAERFEWFNKAPHSLPADVRDALVTWVLSDLPKS